MSTRNASREGFGMMVLTVVTAIGLFVLLLASMNLQGTKVASDAQDGRTAVTATTDRAS